MNLAATTVRNAKMVTLHRSLVGDLETPISAFIKLCPKGPSFLLESAAGGEQVARYSFLGYNPFLVVKGQGMEVEMTWSDGRRQTTKQGPFQQLRTLFEEYALPAHPAMPRFCGGAVGYFGYDNVGLLEPVGTSPQEDELGLPDTYLQFMENILIFDHFTHKLHLVVNRPVLEGESAAYAEKAARNSMQQMAEKLSGPLPDIHETTKGQPVAGIPKGNLTESEFTERVKKAKEYIKAGDIFQVVLSQRFAVPISEEPFAIYRRLRSLNPSPYMFLLNFPDVTLVGASPEMLVRVDGETVTTRPIAGTRRRGQSEAEDRELEEDLLNDPKELAEHVMLVDLGRNDIGRVARYGTVNVKEYAKVERFSHVMHLVSEVTGELAPKQKAMEALEACFPAGTLSGAPKVRAMQIINELETVKRGPYGGAVGYLDFAGNMDTCITIRTMVIKDNTAYIQTGAGIVADSVPEAEYQETIHKAKGMFATLGVQ
ncbi:anthranilate synthase component I [Dethiobacter alkaliphilus]|uniref:Anthranilate synthase component 1 n=1 Tax=Dethiobacter alkaliphilus AHT 1 TaxID=555088 RepID=C0GDK6_DETAL|nr:anthranilate synthase component I [Dethiobacter alkaliphilus]EEG78489.1 anthranilate synthase component I [Dethiobacter alkaliphilus AHT 1]